MLNIWLIQMLTNEGFDVRNAENQRIAIYFQNLDDLFELINSIEDYNELKDIIRERMREEVPDKTEQVIGKYVNEIFRFAIEMTPGDIVVTPSSTEQHFYIGLILSNYFYANHNHYRQVKWKKLSYDLISDNLKQQFGTRSTLKAINEHYREIGKLMIE